jgi:hypothetical protein
MTGVEFLVMDLVLAVGDDHQRKIGYWNILVCRKYCICNVNMHSNLAELLDACKPLATGR